MGVDVARLTLFSFGLAAAIGAIGGGAVAPIMSLQFDAGSFFTNAGFIAVALGGMASLPGAIAGGLFLGVAEQLAAGYVSSLVRQWPGAGLLLATLLWRPQGFFGGRAAAPRCARGTARLSLGRPLQGSRCRYRGASLFAVLLAALPNLVGGAMLSSLVITFILFIACSASTW